MRHKFYLPLGMPVFDAPPVDPMESAFQTGDTYFDTTLKRVRTWDGTKWVAGGRDIIAGNGLTSESGANDSTALHVVGKDGIKVTSEFVTLDTTFTDARYVNASGDVMTGGLVVPNPPAANTHAVSQKYVDDMGVALGNINIASGNGLTGGGPIKNGLTLHVGQGDGIAVSADKISIDGIWMSNNYADKNHGHAYAAPHDHPYSTWDHGHAYAPSSHAHGAYSIFTGGSGFVVGGNGSTRSARLHFPPYFGGIALMLSTANTTVPYTAVRGWSQEALTNAVDFYVNRDNSTNTWFHAMMIG